MNYLELETRIAAYKDILKDIEEIAPNRKDACVDAIYHIVKGRIKGCEELIEMELKYLENRHNKDLQNIEV